MTPSDFPALFENVTGNKPFPWQERLFGKFVANDTADFPSIADIPTGLGKTSIVAIWLLALAANPNAVPRRLVYIVNRRTVVDQTTNEVEKLRDALANKPELKKVAEKLRELCALPLETTEGKKMAPIAISTLRGQLADNHEWHRDPTRPAVIIGTVDMIGSGLLFSRYNTGFKMRPLHAAFLGQDALIIHDEAHLEPAFQLLLEEISAEQKHANDFYKIRVLQLTATRRANKSNDTFGIDENDRENDTVKKRICATKKLSLIALEKDEKLDEKIVKFVKEKSGQNDTDINRAILIFVRTVETALKIVEALDKNETKGKVIALTGTMRGKERDELISKNKIFQRFLVEKDRANSTAIENGNVFLVATSAGEVGVNFSADDCVCDLSTYESMAQRFGRVNRFGERDDSTISVIHETKFGKCDKKGKLVKNKPDSARENTLTLLQKLNGNASPDALKKLADENDTAAAFSPPPEMHITTEIQFDAWALTSIREPIAARPSVAPYLHGKAEWQPPETHLAWRDDRDFQFVNDTDAIDDFLERFPLRSCELLRDTTKRIIATLKKLVEKQKKNDTDISAWLIAENGTVSILKLKDFDKENIENLLAGATLILPASLGGLDKGLFINSNNVKNDTAALDVSEIKRKESVTREGADFSVEISNEDDDEPRYFLWFSPENSNDTAVRKKLKIKETLKSHIDAVVANTSAILEKLNLPDGLKSDIIFAAKHHDDGKARKQWQFGIGNRIYDPKNSDTILAKSNGTATRKSVENYRHEFGSLVSLFKTQNISPEASHLIAAHHGRARPHFPNDEIFDPENSPEIATKIVAQVPLHFAQLQQKYGRWGLAYLESILRAADHAASAGIIAQNDTAEK